MNKTGENATGGGRRCPSCDSYATYKQYETETFPYGSAETAVMLSADVPVHHCNECGFIFTDEAAEKLRHEAVCRHLGVLTPREIADIRKGLALNRSQFAAFTRIGEASIARWESGALIQSAALDLLLRVVGDRDGANAVRRLASAVERSAPTFVCISDVEGARATAARFKLRLREEPV